MVVAGKYDRLQVNIEKKGKEALKVLEWLLKRGYITKEFYNRNKIMVNQDYALDTISFSKKRGIATYYE